MKEGSGLRNQLKAIRTRLGLSQQDLAASAGIARQTIGGIEAELYAPSAMVALRLCRALGCPVEEIFWLEDDVVTVEARSCESLQFGISERVALAQISGKWVAYSLRGDAAFRSEMIPADGVTTHLEGSNGLSVSLLDDAEALARTVVLAGCTPALSLWARSAERWFPGLRVHWKHANSMAALRSLSRGEVHAAGLHLYDAETGEFNAPFVKRMLPGRAVALVNLGVWTEGFLVQPDNPKGIEQVADLRQSGIALINREEGAGSRLLLDALLNEEGMAGDRILGYNRLAGGHQEVARAIVAGAADVGISTEAVAAAFGLGFAPLRKVRYDLALLAEHLEFEPVRQLIGALEHRWVRSQLSILGGFDTSMMGQTTMVAPRGPTAG